MFRSCCAWSRRRQRSQDIQIAFPDLRLNQYRIQVVTRDGGQFAAQSVRRNTAFAQQCGLPTGGQVGAQHQLVARI
jgi:hypothetical protein